MLLVAIRHDESKPGGATNTSMIDRGEEHSIWNDSWSEIQVICLWENAIQVKFFTQKETGKDTFEISEWLHLLSLKWIVGIDIEIINLILGDPSNTQMVQFVNATIANF